MEEGSGCEEERERRMWKAKIKMENEKDGGSDGGEQEREEERGSTTKREHRNKDGGRSVRRREWEHEQRWRMNTAENGEEEEEAEQTGKVMQIKTEVKEINTTTDRLHGRG